MKRAHLTRLNRGDKVRVVGGVVSGVVLERTKIDGLSGMYLVQWNGSSEPSFERRGDLRLPSERD